MNPPSPPNAHVSLSWRESFLWQRALRYSPLEAFERLFRERGDVVQLHRGLRRVTLLNDPRWVRHVLKDHPERFEKTRKRRPVFGDGLVTAEGDSWKRQRRRGAEFVSDLHRREPPESALAELAVREISRWNSGAGFCLFHEVGMVNLAVAARTLFAVELGRDDRESILRSIDVLIRARPFGAALPIPLTPAAGRYRRALEAYRRIVLDRLIPSARRTAHSGDISLLSSQGSGFPPDFDQVSTYLLAASDTTAAAVTAALVRLAERPDLQLAIRRTGDAALPRAVLKEAIRLHPPVWLMSRRVKVSHAVRGIAFTAGSEVAWLPYLLHRRAGPWDAPALFRPERFVQGDPPGAAEAYLPFGWGPRACIGANLALKLGAMLVKIVVDHFDLTATDRSRWECHFTLRPKRPLPISLSRLNAKGSTIKAYPVPLDRPAAPP